MDGAATAPPTLSLDDPVDAVARLRALYETEVGRLVDAFAAYRQGRLDGRVRGMYPVARLSVEEVVPPDTPLAFGFADRPGVYEGSFTRVDLFEGYLERQFEQLLRNHGGPLEIGLGTLPIPLPFAFRDGMAVGDGFDAAAMTRLKRHFDMPSLEVMDDRIVNGEVEPGPDGTLPLALFTAPRVDYSLQRLRHYTGTAPEHFQNYVLFTNYQFYVDAFVSHARETVSAGREGYVRFVEPGNRITRAGGRAEGAAPDRLPQMPAYHLVRPDHQGLTMINIGIGPSNARTITDHVAVMRPNAWIMLGHCAGLRNTQRLGDYVLAHAYHRDDHVLDDDLPTWVPIPALAEVQQSLERAVASVTGLDGAEVKRIMRTGTVASTDNRNWELGDPQGPNRSLTRSRAIAMDMESAAVAANGFRFRVPYGTLLCVSDKPLHGELKLPGMADDFYRRQVSQHLEIGLEAMRLLRAMPAEKLHSRKLRSFNEVPLQ